MISLLSCLVMAPLVAQCFLPIGWHIKNSVELVYCIKVVCFQSGLLVVEFCLLTDCSIEPVAIPCLLFQFSSDWDVFLLYELCIVFEAC